MFYKITALLIFPLSLMAELSAPNKPSKSTNSKFLTASNHSITLHWQDNSDNETGFKIYRKNIKKDYTPILIAITPPNTTTYTDTFLKSNTEYEYTVKATNDLVLNTKQREIADKFISIFENGTQEIQYSYARDIGDGRGITAGKAGFTSATGDMLELIQRYSYTHPYNALAKYQDELKIREDMFKKEGYTINKDTSGLVNDFLKGLIKDWHIVSQSKDFRDLQDKMVDELYYLPSITTINQIGFTDNKYNPLTLLAIYDTYIQHGDSNVKLIISKTDKTKPIDEKVWYKDFLKQRKEERADAISRSNALIDLYEKNFTQLKPLTIYVTNENGQKETYYIPKHVYESAEDGTTIGWILSKGDATNSSIQTDFNIDEENYFIAIKANTLTQYKLPIEDTIHKNFSWNIQYTNDFQITIKVQTKLGTRYLIYTPNSINQDPSQKQYIYHSLSLNLEDDSWKYINRNLEKDIKKSETENILYKIETFSVQVTNGNVYIDEIASY